MPDKLPDREERHSINRLMVFSDITGKYRFKHATLYNFNKDGLHFETEEDLELGTEIVVEISNYMPGPYSPEGSDVFSATVVWCEPIEDSDSFAVGAEITGDITAPQKVLGATNPCEFPFNGQLH